ncbi:MAG: hypothetical protein ACREMT_12345 [Vulcanimicrobiaceae bacterium]
MRRLQQQAIAIEWPLGFVVFLSGFAMFLTSPMQDGSSILGAIVAAVGLMFAIDAVGRETHA